MAAAVCDIYCVHRTSHRLLPLATPLLQWEAPDDSNCHNFTGLRVSGMGFLFRLVLVLFGLQ